MPRTSSGIGQWLRSRLGWESARDGLASRRAPEGSPTPYIVVAAAAALVLQVVSGSLLLLHYHPSVEQAHESVVRISGALPFGSLVRGIHVYSGNLLLAILLVLVLTILFRRGYVPPRELVWLTGVALVPLCVTLAFTGSLLPWSQDAYLNARVGSRMASYVPVIGEALEEFLRGGLEVSSATLQRAFAFHVAILPGALALLLVLHVQVLRAAPRPTSDAHSMPVYPDLVVRLAATAVAVFLVVLVLSVFVEPGVGPAANPTAEIVADQRPAWYLLVPHQLLRIAPPYLLGVYSPKFIGGALTGVFLLILAVPFVDRQGSRVTSGLAIVGLVLAVLLTANALL